MDPITHGAIGMLIGTLGGGDISLANGAMVASMIGAVAPDLDIVAQIWGDYAYLRQHRIFSHSFVGLVLITVATAAILTLIYPAMGFWKLALWALLGAVSHTLMDVFNSYGVGALWPLRRKKYTVNLLTVFDPLLLALVGLTIYFRQDLIRSLYGLLGIIGYLLLRYCLRCLTSYRVVKQLAAQEKSGDVVILPSMNNFSKWEFIVLHSERKIVGKANILPYKLRILREWQLVNQPRKLEAVAIESSLGKVFQDFTPFVHIEFKQEGGRTIGSFMDLRYFVKERFLHNGPIVINSDYQIEKAIFQPYSPNRHTILEA